MRSAQSSRHAVYIMFADDTFINTCNVGGVNNMLTCQRGDVYVYVILFAINFVLYKVPDAVK